MRIQTQGNSNKVWLSSDAGVIEGTLIMSAPTLDKILQAVNEKYGTSLEGWSQIPTVYEVGGTVPNWNAYEKIFGDFGQKIASHFTSANIVFIGRLEDNIYHYYAVDENTAYGVLENEGRIVSTIEVKEDITTLLLEHMNSAGYNVLTIQPEIVSLEMNTIVPNWNDYLVI